MSEASAQNLPFDNSPWVIPIYKEKGPTSFDIIRSLKRHLFDILGKGKGRRKLKIGHFGTLDPFAEGLLLVGTGKALKMVSYFQNEMTKTYLGKGTFSFSTDTGDSEGQRLELGVKDFDDQEPKQKVPGLDQVRKIAESFLGDYEQRPPYFSAVKHEGRPLYEWAREGVFIEKEPVSRVVHSFDILEEINEGEFLFRCEVSSGTYIRGLWSDLSKKLGQQGHLFELKREKWGDISLEFSKKSPVESLSKDDLKRIDKLWQLPEVCLSSSDATKFIQGQYLEVENSLHEKQWVYGPSGDLLGLGCPVTEWRGAKNKLLKVLVNLS